MRLLGSDEFTICHSLHPQDRVPSIGKYGYTCFFYTLNLHMSLFSTFVLSLLSYAKVCIVAWGYSIRLLRALRGCGKLSLFSPIIIVRATRSQRMYICTCYTVSNSQRYDDKVVPSYGGRTSIRPRGPSARGTNAGFSNPYNPLALVPLPLSQASP